MMEQWGTRDPQGWSNGVWGTPRDAGDGTPRDGAMGYGGTPGMQGVEQQADGGPLRMEQWGMGDPQGWGMGDPRDAGDGTPKDGAIGYRGPPGMEQ